jgi:hypothetical protein
MTALAFAGVFGTVNHWRDDHSLDKATHNIETVENESHISTTLRTSPTSTILTGHLQEIA